MDRRIQVSEITAQNWKTIIGALCQRNSSVEVKAIFADQKVRPTYLTRLLEISNKGQIVIERPNQLGVGTQLAIGNRVELIAVDDERRLRGVCKVLQVGRFKLNQVMSVPALQLSAATDIGSAQRRALYRVDVAGSVKDHVIMVPIPPPDGCEPIEVPEGDTTQKTESAIKAIMKNISGGGIGVLVHATPEMFESLQLYPYFQCQFKLPSVEQPIVINARIMHIQPMEHNDISLGLKFIADDPAHYDQIQDKMVKFTTMLQREQLKRQRGVG